MYNIINDIPNHLINYKKYHAIYRFVKTTSTKLIDGLIRVNRK